MKKAPDELVMILSVLLSLMLFDIFATVVGLKDLLAGIGSSVVFYLLFFMVVLGVMGIPVILVKKIRKKRNDRTTFTSKQKKKFDIVTTGFIFLFWFLSSYFGIANLMQSSLMGRMAVILIIAAFHIWYYARISKNSEEASQK